MRRCSPTARPSSYRPAVAVPLRDFAPAAAILGVFLLVFGLLGGWLLAGRMLAPLTRITDATRTAGTGSLSHRIAATGPQRRVPRPRRRLRRHARPARSATSPNNRDSPRMPPTNCAPRSRSRRRCSTWPATIRTATATELVDRLYVVNTRAIDLTEALLLLSRADQQLLHPRTRRPVPHSRRSHRNAPSPRRTSMASPSKFLAR